MIDWHTALQHIRHNIERMGRGLLNFVCPPTCAYCGKDSSGLTELCTDCTAAYFRERHMLCPKCGNTAVNCACDCDFSRITRTVISGKSHVSLTFYTGSQAAYDNDRITERMILQMKDTGRFARFFADELAGEIERLFESSEISLDGWILTYTPRSIENFMKTGVDQSEEVTRYLAQRLGIPYKQTFIKVQGNEQKTLNAEDRMVNASATLVPRRRAIEEGGKYLLVDDIITSGATVMAAARHLYFCGAAEVFPVSVARKLPYGKRRDQL